MERREIIAFAVGLAVALGLTVWGSYWMVNNVIAPPNASDPLSMRGGMHGQRK